MKKWIIVGLILIGCQKKAPEIASRPAALAENNGQQASLSNFPIPNESSYFPLLIGSYWVYESFQEGAKQEGTREVDSVLSFSKSDSGYIALIQEKDADGSVVQVEYKVDLNGLVWSKRGQDQIFEPFVKLNPSQGEKVGNLTTELKCHDTDNTEVGCALLQPFRFDADSLSEEMRMSWNGYFFKKGIGLESQAGPEISSELIEFRIGLNGPVIKTGK